MDGSRELSRCFQGHSLSRLKVVLRGCRCLPRLLSFVVVFGGWVCLFFDSARSAILPIWLFWDEISVEFIDGVVSDELPAVELILWPILWCVSSWCMVAAGRSSEFYKNGLS